MSPSSRDFQYSGAHTYTETLTKWDNSVEMENANNVHIALHPLT